MTSSIVICPCVFVCLFGVTIAWLILFYWHITHVPTWWSVVTVTFRTYEDDKPCCLQLFYDTHTHTQQSSHTLLIIMSKNTEQLPCWDCVTEVETRSWICMKLLTSPLPPVTHHKDPSPKYILKAASIISSHSGNKTEAFPPRDPHTDQIGLTWADYSSIPVVGIAIITIVFNIRMLTVTDSWLYAFTWSI